MASHLKYAGILIKSLFYTGNYNVANMQGTGFAWLVKPWLKKYKLNKEEDTKLSDYFTTNPSFITLIAGLFIKEYSTNRATTLKNVYAPAAAALGDSFFFHAARPMLFLLSFFPAFLIHPAFIAIYPLCYAFLRVGMLFVGWHAGSRHGERAITVFNRLKMNRWADFADKISVFMLGALTVQLIKYTEAVNSVNLLAASTVFIIAWCLRKYLRPNIFFAAFVVIILISLGFYGGYELWLNL